MCKQVWKKKNESDAAEAVKSHMMKFGNDAEKKNAKNHSSIFE
ncbi:14009_t:CDS:2, partial [Entrophospora sp. SA101]